MSMVEVAVAITILSATAIALSNFTVSSQMVLTSSDTSWAIRLANRQADLVRRKLAQIVPDAAMLAAPALTMAENATAPQFDAGSAKMPSSLGVPPVPASSAFHLFNPNNSNMSAIPLNTAVNGQLMRIVMYITQVTTTSTLLRPPGNRRLMAVQIEVYKGQPGTAADNATGGTLLYTTTFLARRQDLDGPFGAGKWQAGFYNR
jgi:hypothetical protein